MYHTLRAANFQALSRLGARPHPTRFPCGFKPCLFRPRHVAVAVGIPSGPHSPRTGALPRDARGLAAHGEILSLYSPTSSRIVSRKRFARRRSPRPARGVRWACAARLRNPARRPEPRARPDPGVGAARAAHPRPRGAEIAASRDRCWLPARPAGRKRSRRRP